VRERSKTTWIGLLAAAALVIGAGTARAETLRLLTWTGYAPEKVIEMFKAETGIDVEVTKSNNEDMISKLRATGGSGFDLAQPSQDRVASAQADFDIYKPIDLSKIDGDQIIPSMLQATKTSTTLDGKVYGVPHVWGTSGLVANTGKAEGIADYTDLCKPGLEGKVTYRMKRPTLIAFAFAMGMDPFAAYNNAAEYQAILDKVEAALIACKKNVKTYWSGPDDLIALMRSGEAVAAMAWDAGGWKLNAENPEIVFVAPKSGALGWIDTFALPRKTENEEAAYKWINFVMRPEVAAMITADAGNFTASKGSEAHVNETLRRQFGDSFSPADIDNIKWYPPVPAGLEVMEGKTLDRIVAAKSG
jgi:spermidine/putrescine transport system substrate-binding protein